MTIKDLILGVVGLCALLLWTLAYSPCFLVRDCWVRLTTGKWTKQ